MSAEGTWFFYCAGVALLLALAARAADAAARELGVAGRWAWLTAMLGSVLVPGISWLGLRMWSSPVPALPDAMALALPVLTLEAVESSAAGGINLLLAAWLCMSALLTVMLGVGIVRLQAARKVWRPAQVDGTPVLLTEDVGPAVFGLRRASILLPAWALTIEEDLRALMLLHEREHVRAGDQWLLSVALLLVVVMPWNPVLWVQLHRLRLAVEMDCDARVLKRSGDARTYGALLLEVGRRRAAPLPVLTLSEPVTFLEQRIRVFTRAARPHAMRRALGLGAVSLSLLVLAVCARDPVSPQPLPVEEELAVSMEGPVFTPYTVKPALKNRAQVAAALQRNYPPLLRDAGIGGQTLFWFFIDAQGVTRKVMIQKSSGHAELDAAATNVAALMEFTPARNGEKPAPVWVSIPITFASRGNADAATDASPRTYSTEPLNNPRPGATNLSATPQNGPYFTPYTQKPTLSNPDALSEIFRRFYPPLLRDAGIGGRAIVWFNIDETGRVADVRINEGTGHAQLDAAALEVARHMTFEPARNQGAPVPVWVAIPITFSSR